MPRSRLKDDARENDRKLHAHVEHIDSLLSKKNDILEAIKEAKLAAEEDGFHKDALAKAVAHLRETDEQRDKRLAMEGALAEYEERLRDFGNTPLGRSARVVSLHEEEDEEAGALA